MSNSWEEKFAFGEVDKVTHTVGGNSFNFYPVSVKTLFALKNIAKPLSKALGTLMADNKNDYGSIERQIASDSVPGHTDREIIIDPVKIEIAELRAKQKDKAIDELVDSFTSAESVGAVGTLIMDSLREIFPPGDKENPPAQEFMSKVPASALYQMLVGVAKANKGMFGPLAESTSGIWKKVQAGVESKLGRKGDTAEAKNQSQSQNPPPAPIPMPAGETSRTTSSGASKEATPPTTSSE